MIEWQSHVLRLRSAVWTHEVLPSRHGHDALERGNLRDDLLHARREVDVFAVVTVCIDCYENLGLDLTEAIEHTADAEVRRAGRPHRPDACRAEHGDDRFRDI